jgi:hypothetical protein
MSKCKFCEAPIVWRKSSAGNWYPVEPIGSTGFGLPHFLFCDPENF